jgi:hypothetical protein
VGRATVGRATVVPVGRAVAVTATTESPVLSVR